MRNDSVADHLRLGATIRPQGRMEWFYDGKSCALGAIAEATGIPYCEDASYWHDLLQRFPVLSRKVTHPITRAEETLVVTIYSLNDGYGWTREDIADEVQKWEHELAHTETRELVELIRAGWSRKLVSV